MVVKRSSRSRKSSSRKSSSRRSSVKRSSVKRSSVKRSSSKKRMSMKKKLALGAAGGLAALIAGGSLYKNKDQIKPKAQGFFARYFNRQKGPLNENGSF